MPRSPTLQLSRRAALALGLALAIPAGALAAKPPFVDLPYANWTDDEPQYRLFPGDELDVAFDSAPELNKTVVVQPDGRIQLPLVPPQMAADRSVPELELELAQAYAGVLLRPDVTVAVRAEPLKVFVGGEVGKPGVYDMPGDMDALRAIIEAGGFETSSDRADVVIIRRGRGGRPMMKTVNLGIAAKGAPPSDLVPLRRFDIVYVPRTGLASFAAVMSQIRDSLPISFSYALGAAVY
ncbi:MAG TPA: polysaccharide biosynthesis/export family protein [Caulobacteraceae bacterium]|nr:polysaccharide biosynthesis/export family protein [Caulobacteraceae bacterium]